MTTVSKMSSATSTRAESKPVRADATAATDTARRSRRVPWLLLLPLFLSVATADYLYGVVGASPTAGSVFLVIAAAAFGVVAIQIGRTIVSALSPTPSEETVRVAGDRRRRELEREKALILKAIKELEFDRAMGKISDDDYRDAHAT